jgi:O-antigen ligase
MMPVSYHRTHMGGLTPRRQYSSWSVGGLMLIAYYFVIFMNNIFVKTEVGQSSYVDEAFAVIILICSLPGITRFPRDTLIVLFLFGIYITLGFISVFFNGLSNYPRMQAAAIGIILDGKIIAVMMGFLYLFRRHSGADSHRAFLTALVGLALVNSVFVLRDMASDGISLYGHRLLIRAGQYQAMGLFHHHMMSANFSVFGAIAAGSLFVGRKKTGMGFAWLWLTGIAIAHLGAKEIIAVGFSGAFLALHVAPQNPYSRWLVRAVVVFLLFLAGIAFLVLLGPVLANRFDLYFGGSDMDHAMRSVLYMRAWDIAKAYFPLGSGAGTFVSKPSRTLFFSPIYDIFGLSSVYGGSRGDSRFLMDAFWPKILGESGFFGLISYVSMYIFFLIRAYKNLRNNMDHMTLFSFLILMQVAIVSLASATLTNEIFVPLIGSIFAFTIIRHSATKYAVIR